MKGIDLQPQNPEMLDPYIEGIDILLAAIEDLRARDPDPSYEDAARDVTTDAWEYPNTPMGRVFSFAYYYTDKSPRWFGSDRSPHNFEAALGTEKERCGCLTMIAGDAGCYAMSYVGNVESGTSWDVDLALTDALREAGIPPSVDDLVCQVTGPEELRQRLMVFAGVHAMLDEWSMNGRPIREGETCCSES